MLPTLAVMMTGQSLLVEYAKRQHSDGRIHFHAASAVFYTETIKLTVATVVWLWQRRTLAHTGMEDVTRGRLAMHGIPAVLFVLQNNVMYWIMHLTDPKTYQLLSCSKLVCAGIVARIFLGQRLTSFQWTAMPLLSVGLAVSVLGDCIAVPSGELGQYTAALLVILNGCLSAISNVCRLQHISLLPFPYISHTLVPSLLRLPSVGALLEDSRVATRPC